MAEAYAPKRVVIAGRTVLVSDQAKPIPPTLQLLLEGGRDARGVRHAAIRTTLREPLRLRGASASCAASSNADPSANHRLARWVEGYHLGSDGLVRYLSLHACQDCGGVCVRDRSIDTLGDYAPDPRPTDIRSAGRRPLRRRDKVIGWYSGARPGQRVYT